MLNTIEAIQELLNGTFLSNTSIIELEIPLTTRVAFALAVEPENGIKAWKLLKDCLDQVQRYPVLTTCWGNISGNWEQSVIDEDLFSRVYFSEEYKETTYELSPEEIIKRANRFNRNDLEEFLRERAKFYSDDLEEQVFTELENTKAVFGWSPSEHQVREQMRSGKILTIVDLEKYLFDWELNHQDQIESSHYLGYLDWYQPIGQTLTLVLLPTPHSWETLAYLSWYGGSGVSIPLLKQWHQRYNAELVCHYGTMLQLFVRKKPSNPQEAFELAWQQIALAPCTTLLPGVSIRHHAHSLISIDKWFIHERP